MHHCGREVFFRFSQVGGVGFYAAQRSVSANVIAMRHHHGHIFIPAQRFGEAVSALQKLGA